MKVEGKLVSFLSGTIGCKVAADVPSPRPDILVTVERTGGGSDGIAIDRPTVAIQCWAQTRADALNLAKDVEAAMVRAANEPWCYKVQKNSEYYYPGEGGEPRYQLVYDMACDPRL